MSQTPQSQQTLQITLNGEPRSVQAGQTVADLLQTLQLRRESVAVERNCEVVRRSDHATAVLHAGDVIELVQFVGGGA